ncbi:MAG: dehydrogenase [Verrucomicrobia bacterium]|nr:dehydrogenase [Verrucomicrobiota bacterium]
MSRVSFSAPLVLGALMLAWNVHGAEGTPPVDSQGRPLNLGFETGDLTDWTATGTAFQGQPVRGDLVKARRADMSSTHAGEYWIGGYEKVGDDPKGTLTSRSFKVTQPWASFRFAAGAWPETRLELVDAGSSNVFFKISGTENETLRPVVVDLKDRVGQEIFIRLVDDRSGHWGHLNFDEFVFHPTRPQPPQEYTLAEARKNEPPPADSVLFAGLSALEAVQKATLPPGFKLHVFASEPDVQQPIAFCDDDRGRLWVAEGFTYPKRVGHPPKNGTAEEIQKDIFNGKDRILVFEDTDGDHRFDRRTVFLEGVNLISGIEYGFGGLWVGAAPYLLFIPIADGDSPRPAGAPQVLLDGWNYSADTHETLNTFTWGPDGWLYGCHGVFCPSNVGKPGTAATDRQWVDAGVWRYQPVQHRFEVFTEGGSNPWGIDFDEYGNLWAEMCVIPHLFHMVQGARITRQGGEHYCLNLAEAARNTKSRDARSGKPVFPYVYEDITTVADHLHYAGNQGPHAGNGRSDASGGGHAHAGLMAYLGTSWPAEYRNQLFIGNIHGQRLNVDRPVPSGSGYIGEHGSDFLNFNDTWSQTLNQRYDPDGSVYIIDWYDKNQCHHNREDGHDRSNGRVYKVVYGNTPKTQVNLARLSDDELAQLVPSKNEWMSRHARRLLQERQAGGAALASARAYLVKVLKTSTDRPARLRALWSLAQTGGLPFETAEALNQDEMLRGWAIQLNLENAPYTAAADWQQPAARESVAALGRLAAQDPSPVVRRFVASGLQRIPVEQRWDVLTALVQHAGDATDHNLPQLYWMAAEGGVATDPDRAIALLKACRIPKVREFIARRLATGSLARN